MLLSGTGTQRSAATISGAITKKLRQIVATCGFMEFRLSAERSMSDEELLAQAASITPVYVDGFGAFRKVNGVLRCIGYVLESGAQLNLIVSLAGADLANQAARRALDEKPAGKSVAIWSGATLL